MAVKNSAVTEEVAFKLPPSDEEILRCLGTQEKDEDKDVGEKLYPKRMAFQTGCLISREVDAGRWELDAAGTWEDRLHLILVSHLACASEVFPAEQGNYGLVCIYLLGSQQEVLLSKGRAVERLLPSSGSL